jgi:hypothetical protein
MQAAKRLSRIDSNFLNIDPQFLSVTLLRFAGAPPSDLSVTARIAARAEDVITRADAHPVLDLTRQRVRRVPGGVASPYWEDDPDFHVDNHIFEYPTDGAVPVARAGEVIADAMSRPLDLDRPLWRVEVIESFEDGSFGLLATQHHAVADGISAYMAMALALLDFTPETQPLEPDAPRWSAAEPISSGQSLRLAVEERVKSVPATARRGASWLGHLDLAQSTAAIARLAAYMHDEPPRATRPQRHHTLEDRSSWNIHPHGYSLLEVRAASRAFSVTITDLLLAAAARAWPSVEPEADEIWVLVPVSLHAADEASATNAVGYTLVPVSCRGDALTTLRAANASLKRVKRQEQARTLGDLDRVKSHLPRRLRGMRWGRIDRADITLSNMLGFPFPIYCQGGQLCEGLASSSLHEDRWGKMTFIGFDDVVYGTLIEDSGPDGVGFTFDKVFKETISELCALATTRTALARQPHFVALSVAELDELARSAQSVTFDAGDEIVRAGEVADSFFVVLSGCAAVSTEGDVLRTIDAGDSFGEIGIFANGVRTATVTASGPVQALRVDKTALLGAFKGDEVNTGPVQVIIDAYVDSTRE